MNRPSNNEMWATFFERFAEKTIRFRWPILLFLVLITGFFLYQWKFLEMETSAESFFLEGDRTYQAYEEFKETFGSDEFVYIVFETEDFFQKDTVKLIKDLSLDLEENVPFVEEMKCLINIEYVEGREDEILVYELMEDFPETPEEMETVRRKVMKKPALINSLISPDGKTSAIILEMEIFPEEKGDARKIVAPKVREILAKPEYNAFTYHVVGPPILDHDLDELASQESSRFGLISLIVEMLILVYIFRSLHGFFGPALVVVLSIIWAFGIIGLLGWKLNTFVMIIPPLIIAVGICDSVHVISEFRILSNRFHKRREALVKTLSLVGLPCLLTSLTTAVCFFSFVAVDIRPIRDFGVHCALGVIFAFILSVILVPILLYFGKNKNPAKINKDNAAVNDIYHRLLTGIGRVNRSYPKVVVAVFILITIISFIGMRMVVVDSGWIEAMHESFPLRQALLFIDSHMGGSMPIEVVVDTGKEDGLKDIKVLKQIESIQQYLNRQPQVKKTNSIIDLLKDLRQSLHGERAEFYTLPDTPVQAAQYLLIYEQAGGKALDELVSFNYSKARITARVAMMTSAEYIGMLKGLKEFVTANIDPTLKVESTGTVAFQSVFCDYIQKGQIKSFIIAFIAIAFMMILVLRSVKLGLISMVPNLLPVLFLLGFIGFAGVYLNYFLMMIGIIIIGIAVDDTIHFFVRFRREFNLYSNYEKAMFNTLESVGRPIMFTTLILVLGFLVFIFSVFSGLVWFGMVGAIAFFVALLADFFFVPSVLLLFKPLGPERQVSMDN